MKILILSIGSTGDVWPYVALALELKKTGNNITIAAAKRFKGLIEDHGINHAPLAFDYYKLIHSSEYKNILSGNPYYIIPYIKKLIIPSMRRLFIDSLEACRDSDMIIFSAIFCGIQIGTDIAEKLNIPCFMVGTAPVFSATRVFPNPYITTRNLGGALNKISYGIIPIINTLFRNSIAKSRRNVLGLPGRPLFVKNPPTIPILYAYSPSILSIPGDWQPPAKVTGYWFIEQQNGWRPPRDLAEFIKNGPPPVYVGFGSMPAKNPEEISKIAVNALKKSGQRGILATGWGAMAEIDTPDSIFIIKSAPHRWLFPRMAAVVHHGGAGTVAEALRAGKPSIVCPFAADQFFWGKVISDLGTGPRSIPRKNFSVHNLSEAISAAVSNEEIRKRASILGEKIRKENGARRAVEAIECWMRGKTR